LPNVRVISRSVDSGRIIDGAAALVTISSTAGLEALIRGVPVLTLGRPGYRRLDTVHEIDDYDELPQAILRATRTGVDTAEVRAYVATALAYGVPRGHPEFPRKMCEQIDESSTTTGRGTIPGRCLTRRDPGRVRSSSHRGSVRRYTSPLDVVSPCRGDATRSSSINTPLLHWWICRCRSAKV